MYKPLILPLAKEDIRKASEWYNKQQKNLGKRFTSEVRNNVRFVCENPNACVVRYKDVRTSVMNIFPFMIHFKIDEKNKNVIIVAVLHTSRNPELWMKRQRVL